MLEHAGARCQWVKPRRKSKPSQCNDSWSQGNHQFGNLLRSAGPEESGHHAQGKPALAHHIRLHVVGNYGGKLAHTFNVYCICMWPSCRDLLFNASSLICCRLYVLLFVSDGCVICGFSMGPFTGPWAHAPGSAWDVWRIDRCIFGELLQFTIIQHRLPACSPSPSPQFGKIGPKIIQNRA